MNMADQLLGKASRPGTCEQVLELIKLRCKVDDGKLNPRGEELVNVRNGMLSWRAGALEPHSPLYLSTFQAQAEFRPGARSELLDKFLGDIFPPDALALAEEIVGHLLIPTTKHQKAFMLVGEGANGKGTFLKLVTELLGRDAVAHRDLYSLEDSTFAAADLYGKLANINLDLPSKKLESSSIFKSLVAGDPITAERKYQHAFTLHPRARLLFSANTMPRSDDRSFAYYRRWIIIPFPNKFEGRADNKRLLVELCRPEVLSALLARGVAGLQRLEQQGEFSRCESVAAKVQEYQVENDSSLEFIIEMLEHRGAGFHVSKIEVWEKYLWWCEQHRIKYPVNQRHLNKIISSHFSVTDMQVGLDRKRCWSGLNWQGLKGEVKY